jgi:squalene synthase HpnC
MVHRAEESTVPRAGWPRDLPGVAAVDGRQRTENFPVALRLLPRSIRDDLLAVYGFARLTDEIGDEYGGDRLAALDWLEGELTAAFEGRATHPVVARLTPTIRRHDLDRQPFRDLIEANRRDQTQHRYADFDDLLGYCRLSANPIGRLVLGVFDVHDDTVTQLSDDVCSALQVIEHMQDVGEDYSVGRIYLPADDMAACGCSDVDLAAASTGAALGRAVAMQCDRAAEMLESGGVLVDRLPRWYPRLAIAGFVAGGKAALDAIRSAGYDVLSEHRGAPRRLVLRHMVSLLATSRRRQAATRRRRELT